MKKELKKIRAVAVRAARRSGAILIKEFERFDRRQVRLKSHYEILTKADLASEKIILGEIMKNFPSHHILAEESGDSGRKSEFVWIVDPVDGTTNFSIHNPLWSISIAVARENRVIFGLVYAPYLKEMYLAERGGGVTRNGRKIRVSDISGGRAMHTFCHGGTETDIRLALKYYQKQKISQFDCRQLGSAAVELAFVAAGRTESILIPGGKPWDVAAGTLIVNEAGGQVTDFSGTAWTINSRNVLATNGLVHDEILKLISRL